MFILYYKKITLRANLEHIANVQHISAIIILPIIIVIIIEIYLLSVQLF